MRTFNVTSTVYLLHPTRSGLSSSVSLPRIPYFSVDQPEETGTFARNDGRTPPTNGPIGTAGNVSKGTGGDLSKLGLFVKIITSDHPRDNDRNTPSPAPRRRRRSRNWFARLFIRPFKN